MKKLNLILAVAAGFLGGALSRYVAPPVARADALVAAPSELRAQSFLLVNEKGAVRGTFSLDASGNPALRLFDPRGREVWSAEGPVTRAATGR
jgi:hypothetical protein